MSLLRTDVKFPYCDINGIYLKCGNNERLKQLFMHMTRMLYPECTDVVYPVNGDEIVTNHFTYNVSIVQAETFYATMGAFDVFPWRVNAITVQVPYGNIPEWGHRTGNWLSLTTRALRALWHGIRLIPNDTPNFRTRINLGIPWIPLDKSVDDCLDNELYDYIEIVLSSISAQVWVNDRKILTPHVHSC